MDRDRNSKVWRSEFESTLASSINQSIFGNASTKFESNASTWASEGKRNITRHHSLLDHSFSRLSLFFRDPLSSTSLPRPCRQGRSMKPDAACGSRQGSELHWTLRVEQTGVAPATVVGARRRAQTGRAPPRTRGSSCRPWRRCRCAPIAACRAADRRQAPLNRVLGGRAVATGTRQRTRIR
jgi:hypothetical protein